MPETTVAQAVREIPSQEIGSVLFWILSATPVGVSNALMFLIHRNNAWIDFVCLLCLFFLDWLFLFVVIAFSISAGGIVINLRTFLTFL